MNGLSNNKLSLTLTCYNIAENNRDSEISMKKNYFLYLVLLIAPLCISAPPAFADQTTPRIDSKQLANTTVTPYLHKPIHPNENLIFCSTFQIVWDKMAEKLRELGWEALSLPANRLMEQYLNESISGASDLSDDAYLAMIGFGYEGIVGKIKEALQAKFNDVPSVDLKCNPDDLVAYAYLKKVLAFDTKFEKIAEPINFGGAKLISAFGIKKYGTGDNYRKMGEQVAVFDYKNDNNFIVRLTSKSFDDEIVIAKVAPEATLLATLDAVQSRISKNNAVRLKTKDVLKIPKFDFNIIHDYKDDFRGSRVAKAGQTIEFKLNEEGAILKSEAYMVRLTSCGAIPEAPKLLVFDKPFLVYLKGKDAKEPYFVMWIDNPGLLLVE